MIQRKFVVAMSAYAVLAVVATFTLDGVIREALWILLGGLAVKTWIAQHAGW